MELFVSIIDNDVADHVSSALWYKEMPPSLLYDKGYSTNPNGQGKTSEGIMQEREDITSQR